MIVSTTTIADLTAWQHLLACAEACVAEPTRPVGDLGCLIDRAWGAVIPTDDPVGRADCFNFIHAARHFASLSGDGRTLGASALNRHATKAAAWLNPQSVPTCAVLPFRAPHRSPNPLQSKEA